MTLVVVRLVEISEKTFSLVLFILLPRIYVKIFLNDLLFNSKNVCVCVCVCVCVRACVCVCMCI